jgi:hypothetical protein
VIRTASDKGRRFVHWDIGVRLEVFIHLPHKGNHALIAFTPSPCSFSDGPESLSKVSGDTSSCPVHIRSSLTCEETALKGRINVVKERRTQERDHR